MNVSEAIELAKGWVSAEASQAPGFLGAYLGGSLSSLLPEAPFPLYRDLDLYIISQAEKDRHIRPYLYKGLMVDAQYSSPKYYQSPEIILANPHLANTAIQNDAPASEKRAFQARYDSLLQDLGLSKPNDWQQRQQQLRSLVTHFFNLAANIVTSHPMIRD